MRKDRCLLGILVVLLCARPAVALFAGPSFVPVDRLIANTTAFVRENAEDPHGYYTLGRIHYLAFANEALLVGVYDPGSSPPKVVPDWLLGDFVWHARNSQAQKLALEEMGYASRSNIPEGGNDRFWALVSNKREQLEKQGWLPEKLSSKQTVEHAAAAVRNFKKAIELAPANGLYHLGLASLLDQYVDFLNVQKVEAMPEEFSEIILDKAKDVYWRAYELSIRKDLELKHKPLSGLLESLVGYEAGKAYIRLSQAGRSIPEEQKKRLSRVKRDLKKLDSLPDGGITPIILSLERHRSLSDLLVPDLHVRFDLDGDGVVELWPWVAPTTGILVWDPDARGEITSGRQMFGSVSWWLFFEDGYHALDALDDSRDGALSGCELDGIAVWFDRNSNGRSEPGEVSPVEQLQIVSLAIKSSGQDGDCPMNRSGVALADGRVLATYDWIVSGREKGAK
ncbi:MAG: hypothetical protein ACYTEL_08860 [Planctomycetota bacterium]